MRRWTYRLGVCSLLAALLATGWVLDVGPVRETPVLAQPAPATFDETFFSGLRWRAIGPNRGGRSTAVAGSASRPNEYYFGATGGGLWKTTDGGTTWNPVSDGAFKTSSVGAVAVAASNPDIVYVGMGETQLRGNIIQGDGVYKSTDAGKTWQHVGLEKTMAIARIRIHPRNPDLVYVAALGHPYGPSPDRGVYRTRDGGKTWERILFRDEKTGAVDLSMDPNNPDVLYAGLWEVYRTPHSLSSGGPGSGLFKSTDGGTTWQELTKNPGLPGGIWGKVGVSVSGADSTRVYAIIENEKGGVFVSDDAGATWKQVNDERRLRQRAFYYTRIYADPKTKDTVYVLNTGFYRSTDGGKTYRAIRVPHGDNHDLWIDPTNPARMINSNDGGANVSINGGETWTDQDYPTAQFYNVFTTRHIPYHVCGAQQDNSTACVSSAGDGDVLYAVGGGESGYIAPDPTDLNVFYAGSYGGLITRLDRATGQERVVNAWPENPMGHSSKDIKERFQWTFPIVFSRTDPKVLYIGSQHLWRTTNGGQSWERISPDLTRADPSTMGPSGGPITLDQTGVETYATIFTIAPSPHDGNTIWVGSDDGLVHVTRDGGRTWTKITPPDLPEFARISLIEASPHRPGTAYVAANRYQRGDRSPYVYRTDDYGQTWTKIVGGLPGDDFARAIREDTKRPKLLYLGTEHGIYVSFDDGGHWQSLRLNLPVTPVHGIVVEENDLVIGTHGRAFYVLPNIGVLRQLTPEVTTATLHVFTPADAVRYRPNPIASIWRRSGGFGPQTPVVPVDYYLKSDADKVTIEILDGSGTVIRSFTGSAEEEKKRAEARRSGAGGEEEEFFGAGRPPSVGLKKGMNRFVWDLRYEGAASFPGLIMWAANTRGPLAPPGRYQVRVSALGETKTASFGVRKDPRLTEVTDADLQEQFRLAKEINDKVSFANRTVIRIRHLKGQIQDRSDKAKNARLTAAAEALAKKLTDVEGEIYQYRNQSNQDPLNFPIKLNNKLAALQGVVESAEAKPTDQSYAVFKDLSARLDAEVAKLEQILKTDLPAFNKLVVASRLDPVKDEMPKTEPSAE
jgi:photosystem II stability/assembly factor-like uncharacterized protein